MSETQEPSQPETGKPKKPPRPMWQTLLYNAMPLIFLAVVGAIGIPVVQDMMAPPRRNLYVERPTTTPGPAVTATPAPTPAPPGPTPAATATPGPAASADLVRAYGTAILAQVKRDATRLALLGQDVARCRTRDATWIATLREVVGPDIASHYNSFEGKPEDTINLARYATQQYAASNVRPETQRDCADIPALPEFRAADTLVRTKRAATPR